MKPVTILSLSLAGALLTLSGYASASTLAERWQALRAAQPKVMIRDAARTLGVSEAELLATDIGKSVTRLKDDDNAAREIMRRALDLGTVLALTRNENGVIERTGVATRLKPEDPPPAEGAEKDSEREARQRNIAGGYLGGEIDLRFTFDKWKHAFAVVQTSADGTVKRSLQFFDASGTAAHKVYVKDDKAIPVFDKLVADFRHKDQAAPLKIVAAAPKAPELADNKVDIAEFHQAWADMGDVHQFNRLLSEFKISREQAFRLAPKGMAQRVTPAAVRVLLDEAAKQKLPLMAFLGNGAVIQIYSGTIVKTAASGDWYNVLDPAFNLHLRDSAFRSGWVVQRAGVTSIEFFDNNGDLVVTFFGVRERGKPQPKSWTDLASSLPKA
jgi:putative hemin transport protein